MSQLVIDTSVAVKWFLTETHSEAARKALGGGHELLAPDLIIAEFGNVFWKRTRSGDVSEGEAAAAVNALLQMPLQLRPSGDLILAALEIANRTQRSVYDSLHLALAVAEDASLVTADGKLFNALQATPLLERLVRVGDL